MRRDRRATDSMYIIEKEAEYVAIAEARLNGTQRGMGLVG